MQAKQAHDRLVSEGYKVDFVTANHSARTLLVSGPDEDEMQDIIEIIDDFQVELYDE